MVKIPGSMHRRVNFGGHAGGPAYLLVRLPLQFFLIAGFGGSLCVPLDLISMVRVEYRK